MTNLETIYSQYCERLVPFGIQPASVETYCRTVYDEKDEFVLQTIYAPAAQLAGYRARGANSSRKALTRYKKG